jgi:hypothetical protein
LAQPTSLSLRQNKLATKKTFSPLLFTFLQKSVIIEKSGRKERKDEK